MSNFFWEKVGTGKQNVVLLHGWGLNSEVWRTIVKVESSANFCFHFVDLPGYGRNYMFPPLSLEEMTEIIWEHAPKQSIWLGWSLGGLIASVIALKYSTEITGLITVASSPCFIQKDNWPGIKSIILQNFEQQLRLDFNNTIERFLELQILDSKKVDEDIKLLKLLILKQPLPSSAVLKKGLRILQNTDLRESLLTFKKPFLRIYGDLDTLVPRKISSIIDTWLPKSFSIIMKHAAHAPFISHPYKFVRLLIDFSDSLKLSI
ncbi:pimeloyl-ACP methyl ester esterase BioH [Arsenophonus symbiont of Ornithomya chloropus]|uniref:pimeloyl-ACP methyl ester esterase BioH n=1 Tax=Arsenophonus symbiont of Ornithomya chloropus TaxID=634121 RepID=UPI0032B1CEDF